MRGGRVSFEAVVICTVAQMGSFWAGVGFVEPLQQLESDAGQRGTGSFYIGGDSDGRGKCRETG